MRCLPRCNILLEIRNSMSRIALVASMRMIANYRAVPTIPVARLAEIGTPLDVEMMQK